MNRTLTAICLSSLLALSYVYPQKVVAQSNKGSREGLPGRRIGGGTRGECSHADQRLTALVPENNLGLTKAARPKLFFYLPPTSTPKTMEFVLQDDKENVIYETNFTTVGSKGIISVSLPDSASIPPLAFGKNYRWFLSIICNPEKRENDVFVDGWIKRVELDPSLNQKLEQASPVEQAKIYAASGLWQDALATLVELRYKQPNNSNFVGNWSQLLRTLKLDVIAQEPILDMEIKQTQ